VSAAPPPSPGPGFQIFPEAASTIAGEVDLFFYLLCAMSIVITLIVFGLIVRFGVRYRRRTKELGPIVGQALDAADTKRLEAVWIAVPLVVFLGIFYWGAKLYAAMSEPPPDAMEIYAVGKRWMWKLQHPSGRREINELHVPLGRPVKLIMTSEDVIHAFYVPAFRVKADVLPGRYTSLWFQATKAGSYHLFCAEYCGTKHSEMIGRVVVMDPAAFQSWLSGPAGASLAAGGERLFAELGCATCHRDDTTGKGPRLRGLFGRQVQLQTGELVTVDESYLRESIVEPQKKLVAGYKPEMPTYVAQLDEEGLLQLVAYIKSLREPLSAPPAGAAPVASAPASAEPAPSAEPAASAEPAPSAAPAGEGAR
jgi:cytochrome c oxidase subunit 2